MPRAGLPTYRNKILAALPQQELARIAPHLTPIELGIGLDMSRPGEKPSHGYFVESGMASIVTVMKNGDTVETGLVGMEGVVGVPVLLGTESTPGRTFMQIAGKGFSIKTSVLSAEFERGGTLYQKVKVYLQAHLVQTAQIAACNRLHDIAPRLARWLLMCHDRMESDTFEITHEFLGQMLGAPRSTVTLAAGILQKAELITYTRGRVRIQDRKGLQAASCECYRTIRDECDRLGIFAKN